MDYSLIWKGHFYHKSGFSCVSYNYARVLKKYLNLYLSPLPSPPSPLPESDYADIVSLFTDNPPVDKFPTVVHTTYSFTRPKHRYQIFYTIAEGSKPLPIIAQHTKNVNEVWVPSKWTQKAFANVGIASHVIPHGVDLSKFIYRDKLLLRDKFRFLSIHEDTYRKGRDILIKAFTEEFKPHEKVELYIKTNNYESVSDRRIIFDTTIKSRNEIAELYRTAHVFVLATLGEAYLLPYVEAGATGLPVIATNATGHLDYLSKDNAYLISVYNWQDIPGVDKDILYPYPNVKHLRELMRYVYENYEEARKRGKKLRNYIENNCTWEHGAKVILERINEVYGELT